MNKSLVILGAASLFLAACSGGSGDNAQGEGGETAQAENSYGERHVIDGERKGALYTGEADNIALSGYDPVSYFIGDGTPVKGSESHIVEYQGVEYHFANSENLRAFTAEPAKYAPQYGGHCAWAASRGKLAPGDPNNYDIVDGKLYLNFNDDTQKTWESDSAGFIEKADKEYAEIPADQSFHDAKNK